MQQIPDDITDQTKDFTGRHWAFQRINDWVGDEHGPRAFLVGGEPGCGKTVLAARLVQMSQGQADASRYPNLGAGGLAFFHFCQASNSATLDPLDFTRSLSLALSQRPAFAAALTETRQPNIQVNVTQNVGQAVDSTVQGVVIHLQAGDLNARTAFNHLVRRPLEALCTPEFREKILILVDSMDEALTIDPEHNIAMLLGYFLDHPDELPSQVRFVLTGRFHDPRLKHLWDQPILNLVTAAQQEGDGIGDDIFDYALTRLAAYPSPGREALARKVATASRMNFLYARYSLDELAQKERLPENIARIYLPEGLLGIYREFFRREVGASEFTWKSKYRPILGFLAAARDPGLSFEQLVDLSEMPESEVRDVLNLCYQYLAGRQPDGPFRIYHESFREFLGQDEWYGVYPAEAEQRLGSFYYDLYHKDWSTCEEAYALRNTASHLARSAARLQRPAQREKRKKIAAELEDLLGDLGFLEARLEYLSIYEVLADLRAAIAAVPELDQKEGRAVKLRQVLDLEAHHLQAWDREKQPARLAQQVLNRAKQHAELQSLVPAAASRLNALEKPYFELNWSARREPGLLVRSLTGQTSPLTVLAITPDGTRVLGGCRDGSVCFWDLNTGRFAGTLVEPDSGRAGRHRTREAISRGLTLDSEDDFPALRGDNLNRLYNQPNPVTGLVVAPDNRTVFMSWQQATIRVLDLGFSEEPRKDTTILEQFLADLLPGSITSLGLSPDGTRLAGVLEGRKPFVWEMDRESVWLVPTKARGTSTLALTNRALILAVTGPAGAGLEVWDLERSKLAFHQMPTHRLPITAVHIFPEGSPVLSAGADGALTLWDLEQGDLIDALIDWQPEPREDPEISPSADELWEDYLARRARQHADWPKMALRRHSLDVTPDQKLILSGLYDGTIHLWSRPERILTNHISAHRGPVQALKAVPGSRYAVSAGSDNTVKVWDLIGRQEKILSSGHREWVNALAFTPQGNRLISGSDRGTIIVWDVDRGEEIHTWQAHDGWVLDFAFSPGRRTFYSAGGDRWVRSWDLENFEQKVALHGHEGRVTGLYVTGEDEIISSSADGSLILWDTATKQPKRTFKGHRDWVIRVKGIPGRRRMISTSRDATLIVWDLDTGERIYTLEGHTAQVDGVAVTRDGRYAVSASYDHTLRIWDLVTGACVRVIEGHQDVVQKVVLATDDRTIFSISLDRTVRAWDFDSGRETGLMFLPAEGSSLALDPAGEMLALSESSGNIHTLQLRNFPERKVW